MIIKIHVPSRISLFGGSCDFEPYAKKYGAIVISMAINIRQSITLFLGDDIWAQGDSFPPSVDRKFLYSFMDAFNIGGGHMYKVASNYDGLIGAGLGSSSALAVGMVGGANKILNLGFSLSEIAHRAWQIENTLHYTGKQDIYASAFGGINVLEIKDSVNVTPLARGFIEPLVPSFVLFHTGIKRINKDGERKLTKETIKMLDNMKKLTISAIDAIGKGDIKETGEMLDLSWNLKKMSNNTTNSEIDSLYEKAKECGAYGGKILGAGGGGYMLCIVKNKEQFVKDMNIQPVDFSVDFQGLDVRVL